MHNNTDINQNKNKNKNQHPPLTDNKKIEEALYNMITNDNIYDFSNLIREDIKHNAIAYYASVIECLISALRSTFKTLEQYIGEKKFHKIAKQYIQSGNLPQQGYLIYYGESFPQWLEKNYQYNDNDNYNDNSNNKKKLYDLAKYDLAYNELLYAENYNPINKNDFSNINPNDYPKLLFTFPKAFKLLEFSSNIINNKTANHNINQTKYFMIMNKLEYNINHYEIDKSTFTFLQELQKGNNLEEAFKKATIVNESFNLENNLINAISRGYFNGVKLND